MIELTIKAESSADLLEQMSAIAAGLLATEKKTKAGPQKEVKDKAEPDNARVPAIAPAKNENNLTIETLRAAIADKSKEGKREAIKELLKEFCVSRATDLTPDQYTEFKSKLAAV